MIACLSLAFKDKYVQEKRTGNSYLHGGLKKRATGFWLPGVCWRVLRGQSKILKIVFIRSQRLAVGKRVRTSALRVRRGASSCGSRRRCSGRDRRCKRESLTGVPSVSCGFPRTRHGPIRSPLGANCVFIGRSLGKHSLTKGAQEISQCCKFRENCDGLEQGSGF